MTQTLRYDFLNNPSLVPDTESPSTTPDLSVTRATKATMVDADGYIREVQAGEARFTGATFDHNLLLQSNDFDTTWVTANAVLSGNQSDPDGGTDAWLLSDNSAGGTGLVRLRQNPVVLSAGKQYFLSLKAKASGLNNISIRPSAYTTLITPTFNLTNGTATATRDEDDAGTVDLGDGWYLCWVLFTLDADASGFMDIYLVNPTHEDITVDLDGTSSVLIYEAQVQRAVSGDTVPGTYVETTTAAASSLSGTSNGLLVEEARTTIATWTEDNSNAAWVKSNITVGSDSVTSPDGSTNTNVRLTASAGNGTILQTVTNASANRTYSVYLKRVTGTGNIDLTTDSGTTWTTKTLTSEWQRFDISQAAVTNPSFGIRIVTSGDAIDAWGHMQETGLFPTSYISNNSATASVTRNADADITPANVTWANASQGTFYVRAKMENVVAADQPLLELSDASTSDRIHILCGATDGSLDLETDTTTGTDGDIAGTEDFTAGTFGRAAVGYADDDCIVYLDGTSGGTEASATLPPSETLTKFLIGSNQDGEYGNCHISEIRFYSERSNALAENLSNGLFPIPDVTGLTQAAATTLLLANGFAVATGTPIYSGDFVKDTVALQDDVAGAYVAAGTTVTISLSLGPKSGGRSKKGRKYSVEIDEEIFLFDTIAEAQEFLLLTRETAEAAAQKELQRAEKTKTPVKVPRVKVKLITGKPSASKALADAEADAERAIQEAYQKAAEARIQKLAQIAKDIPGKGIQTRADMSRKAKAKRQKQIDELEALIALLL